MYDLHPEGQLADSQWKIVRSDIKALLNQPIGNAPWKDILRHNMDETLAGRADSLEVSEESTCDFSTNTGRD
jgi:hypothetical protein